MFEIYILLKVSTNIYISLSQLANQSNLEFTTIIQNASKSNLKGLLDPSFTFLLFLMQI